MFTIKIKSQVRLKESTNYFAMKVLSKQEMIARNKVRVPVGRNQQKNPGMAPRVKSPMHLLHITLLSHTLHTFEDTPQFCSNIPPPPACPKPPSLASPALWHLLSLYPKP